VSDAHNLQRFVGAQAGGVYETTLAELRDGSKQSHWMWFIFPQLAGLGLSPAARQYAIASADEARAYLAHALLGPRLRECAEALLPWAGRLSAEQILGHIDGLKLRSSLTLFNLVEPDTVFAAGLAAFFRGEPDGRTLALLNALL
jgi:uncharacterized protein (DUF1810 family)